MKITVLVISDDLAEESKTEPGSLESRLQRAAQPMLHLEEGKRQLEI